MTLTFGTYQISTDANNVILERLTKPKPREDGTVPEPRWATIGYYSTLRGAVNGMIEDGVRESDAAQAQVLVERIEAIRDEVLAALAPAGIVVGR